MIDATMINLALLSCTCGLGWGIIAYSGYAASKGQVCGAWFAGDFSLLQGVGYVAILGLPHYCAHSRPMVAPCGCPARGEYFGKSSVRGNGCKGTGATRIGCFSVARSNGVAGLDSSLEAIPLGAQLAFEQAFKLVARNVDFGALCF